MRKYRFKERHEVTEQDRAAIYQHAMQRSNEIVFGQACCHNQVPGNFDPDAADEKAKCVGAAAGGLVKKARRTFMASPYSRFNKYNRVFHDSDINKQQIKQAADQLVRLGQWCELAAKKLTNNAWYLLRNNEDTEDFLALFDTVMDKVDNATDELKQAYVDFGIGPIK
jgi:hypothetical protein